MEKHNPETSQKSPEDSDPFGWNETFKSENSKTPDTPISVGSAKYNYDYPEIISEQEADKLIGQAPPEGGLYKTFEEIRDHSPEQLKDLMLYLEFDKDGMLEDPELYYSDLVETYATIASYLDFGNLYDKEKILAGAKNAKDYRNHDYKQVSYYGIDPEIIERLPEHYTAKTEAIPLSSYLHLIHQTNPEIREEAMESEAELKTTLAKEAGIDLNLEYTTILPQPEGVHLTGKDGFPIYLRELVEEKLRPIRDDLKVNYHVTWMYSHNDQGLDYDYSLPEYPEVTIYSTSPESAEKAEKLVDSITQEEANEWQRKFERQGIHVFDDWDEYVEKKQRK